ncbi:MAG: bifunctional metallophosphatase/5'-nucleotidase [Paramuribaculum sp.]|nr:bifunctional metallophosphatase/5'-nucleotidase [Paramuribaculum sp.]
MKSFFSLAAIATLLLSQGISAENNRLVILHTNDTHSQIFPNNKNLGGVERRMVLVDSVRNANDNVILIDAGDAVQGTLFFTLFGGETERKIMNEMGYDIRILGNHEFDNGMESIADNWSLMTGDKLSTNYDFSGTPLDTIFAPYTIKQYGDKKIGFIAINLRPHGMIADANAEGVEYLDPYKAANATAWHLKHNERADYVVAVTHIGYKSLSGPGDVDLAANTENIDIIIGGHSHTTINPADPECPPNRIVNLAGDTVLIAQNGKGGVTVGEITLDLDKGTKTSRLITVDSRFDNSTDSKAEAITRIIAPYQVKVDSIRAIVIGRSPREIGQKSPESLNLMADICMEVSSKLYDKKIDLAIINKGGIRCGMPKGDITKGLIMEMLPFDNRYQVLEISGKDLMEGLDVMARRGGDAVSKGVEVEYDPTIGECVKIVINGEPIDPSRTYTLATIDYLAGGGDYMESFRNATLKASSPVVVYDDVINYLGSSRKRGNIKPDNRMRMKPVD